MRGGSSIMNMMAGDAEKSIFTMANLWSGSEADKRRRAEDASLLMLNPYFLARILVQLFKEVGRELWEASLQRVKNVQPRLNRMQHWYPLVRAAMCSPMRDMTTNVAILDIMRGVPAIYMLYLGYDEVAHHSGPWTADAFGDLRRLDRAIARLRNAIAEKAPRPYSLIVLSDHGQSFGATFKQRYGVTIRELIEQQLPQGATVAQAIGGDRGAAGLQGVAGEFANMQQMRTAGALGARVARQGEKLAQRGAAAAPTETHAGAEAATVTAYGSGNAAQVYFDLFGRKIKLSELEAAYPGMVDALVRHEGLGMVIGYDDDMTAVVLGKGGRRNLHTGCVEGDDPLAPFAPAEGPGAASLEKRVWQLRRVMDFPSAGDLWLISTVYPDGTVAALEELVGSHGGVGGEQTDAFLFHPPSLDVPETRNSTDVFHILDRHRAYPLPAAPPAPSPAGRDWSPATLLKGLMRPRVWLRYAWRCLLLDPDAYRRVARDRTMSGPALLIVLFSLAVGSLEGGAFNPLLILAGGALWFLMMLMVFAVGHLLSQQGSFTRTFRALSFAQTATVLELFALYAPIAAVARPLALILNILALWMAGATAHNLKGWRAAVLPLILVLVYILGGLLAYSLVTGASMTWQTLLDAIGLTPQ